MEIKERHIEISEGPREITINNVMYWSEHAKELKGEGFLEKSKKFLANRCIKYIGNNKFICLPLNQDDSVNYEGTWYPKLPYEHNYNSKTYLIENKNNRFYCNCQGWNAKEEKNESRTDGVQCSHSLSLILCFKLNYFKKIGNFYENERQNF